MITNNQILAAARSDATFDGRDFDTLGRADRQRYYDRAQRSLWAAEEVRRLEGEEAA